MKRKSARKTGKKPAASGSKKHAPPKGAGKRRPQGSAKGRSKQGAETSSKAEGRGTKRPGNAKSSASKAEGRGRKRPGNAKSSASKAPGRGPKRPDKRVKRPPKDASQIPPERPADGKERLQKVLAAAGLGSRRQCEELILTGRVEIDHQVVMELGTRVDPLKQLIRVDGVELRKPKTVWYALNKPVGVVCTNRDPGGRPRAVDLVPESRERLFPVGRLDMSSEGLLLLTNDGDMANQLTHPSYGVTKTYRVLVAGQPEREILTQIRRGVYLSEGLAKVTGVTIKQRYKKSTVLEMVLQEGRNREIRRVLARVGHKVMRLVRIATGPVKLGELQPGESRRLTRQEIDALRRHVREKKR